MKRFVLGLTAAAAAALTASPAAAQAEVQYCYATVIFPCGVCVYVGDVSECSTLR